MIFVNLILVILGVMLIALGINELKHNKFLAVCSLAIGSLDILQVVDLLLK